MRSDALRRRWRLTLCGAALLASGMGTGIAQTPAGGGGGLRAQLVAVRQVTISSELAAKVSSMPLREGQSFRQGETLVAYDCALNHARLARSSESEAAARNKLEVAEQLEKLSAISQGDLIQARGAVAIARAESGVERVMVRRCIIAAPFAGRVGETFVRASEHVAEGKELLSIYDDSAFELETIVPSRWLAWLRPGYPVKVTIDETGQTHAATVVRIAGRVDPVSQSVKVIGRLANDKAARGAGGTVSTGLLPGMSGTVQVDAPAGATAK